MTTFTAKDINKDTMIDSMGRQRTQSLFLEHGYGGDAIFTTKDHDYKYKGKQYISLKKLYLAAEDPTEYLFANEYLLGWQPLKKMRGNKLLAAMFDEWKEEAEIRIRAIGLMSIIELANAETSPSFQAAKYVADGGWKQRGVGRPTSEQKLKDNAIKQKIADEFESDMHRMN